MPRNTSAEFWTETSLFGEAKIHQIGQRWSWYATPPMALRKIPLECWGTEDKSGDLPFYSQYNRALINYCMPEDRMMEILERYWNHTNHYGELVIDKFQENQMRMPRKFYTKLKHHVTNPEHPLFTHVVSRMKSELATSGWIDKTPVYNECKKFLTRDMLVARLGGSACLMQAMMRAGKGHDIPVSALRVMTWDDWNATDNHKIDLVQTAASTGYLNLVPQDVLQRYVVENFTRTDRYQETLLHKMARGGTLGVMDMDFLRRIDSSHWLQKNKRGFTPIQCAAQKGATRLKAAFNAAVWSDKPGTMMLVWRSLDDKYKTGPVVRHFGQQYRHALLSYQRNRILQRMKISE